MPEEKEKTKDLTSHALNSLLGLNENPPWGNKRRLYKIVCTRSPMLCNIGGLISLSGSASLPRYSAAVSDKTQ